MKHLETVRLDPQSEELLYFRREIVEIEHQSTMDAYNNVDFPEDAYKFAHKKWNKTHFDALYGIRYNGELACISGCRIYGSDLRFGMMYYLLKRFSSTVRSGLWKDGGLWDKPLTDFPGIDYSFMTIYPHNEKLKSWLHALTRGRGYGQMGDQSVVNKLKTLEVYPKPFQFNGVYQYLIYRTENINTNRSPQDVVKSIEDSNA
jgi:hypothetical protein